MEKVMTDITTTIEVAYQCRDGWHVFTSEDISGLYIASPDLEMALNDVPLAIEGLFELDLGIKCRAKMAMSNCQA